MVLSNAFGRIRIHLRIQGNGIGSNGGDFFWYTRRYALRILGKYSLRGYSIKFQLGAAYGPNIKRYGTTTDKPNLGQSFVVIDPSFFAPGFEDRLSDLLDYIRHLEPVSISSVLKFSKKMRQCLVALKYQQCSLKSC